MTKQVPFIDREQELSQIEHAIKAWNTRQIFCINAFGGIGKTRLLQEIRRRYGKSEHGDSLLIVADIIDFDNRTLHLPQNLGRHIATLLKETIFKPYLQALFEFHKMETAGVSVERLSQLDLETVQTFVRCFNELSEQQRVVLLLDTTDALEGTEILNYLEEMTPQLTNSLLLLAGRNARSMGESLQVKLGEDVHIIDLFPLQDQASEAYLQQKQELTHVTLVPELAQKILFLSGGRPILIDLAVEWLAREIPLTWIAETSLHEIATLAEEEKAKRRQEFERQLVLHIADTRRLIDWLILVMSRVYPLNVEMIAKLLAIPENEAKTLFEEAQSYVFVKELPDGRISLHDEMRRMVNEYVWPEVDPDSDRRRRDSAIAVDCLEQEIQTLTTRIKQLQEEEQTARKAVNAQAALDAFVAREPLERELWVLKRQKLGHLLFMDITKGVTAFADMFDEATLAYRFYVRETLLNQINPYSEQLSPEQHYKVDSRRVELLRDYGDYARARDLATAILQKENVTPEQQIDMLIQRGNAEIRLAHLDKGKADFEQAVQISRERNLQNWLVRALNARGWAFRNQGDFKQALTDYREAYQLSLHALEQTASILNNMGFVNALKGDRDAAFENCQAALRLWEQIGFRRGMGAAYSTLGRIYRKFNQLEDAIDHYNKALDIFESENDIDWISKAKCGKATVLWNQKNLDQSEELFTWVFENGPPNLKPWTLYNLAQIALERKNFELARRTFQRCREVSREFDEDEREYRSFMRLIHVAWEMGEYSRWQEFEAEYKRLYAERAGGINLALRGSTIRRMADLAICNGDYEAALTFYKEGLVLITKYGIHQPFNYEIEPQLREIDEQLRKSIPGNVLSKLGKDLAQFWSENEKLMAEYADTLSTFQREKLMAEYADALSTFQQWEQKGGDL